MMLPTRKKTHQTGNPSTKVSDDCIFNRNAQAETGKKALVIYLSWYLVKEIPFLL